MTAPYALRKYCMTIKVMPLNKRESANSWLIWHHCSICKQKISNELYLTCTIVSETIWVFFDITLVFPVELYGPRQLKIRSLQKKIFQGALFEKSRFLTKCVAFATHDAFATRKCDAKQHTRCCICNTCCNCNISSKLHVSQKALLKIFSTA